MVWFLREPSANRARILDLRKMKCAYPDKMNTKSITLLREADICSASKYKNLYEVCTMYRIVKSDNLLIYLAEGMSKLICFVVFLVKMLFLLEAE